MQFNKLFSPFVFSLFLLLCCIYLSFQLFSLNESSSMQIQHLNHTLINQTNRANEFEKAYFNLSKKFLQLEKSCDKIASNLEIEKIQKQTILDELEIVKQNLSRSEQLLEQSFSQAQQLKSEFVSLQNSINDSMSWFKQNSRLDKNHSWAVDIFLKRINSDCIYEKTLNLACINYLNERTILNLQYLSDSDTNQVDHLQSLNQTISRRGGDCEDFALFFKSILQTLKSKDDLYIKTWEPSDSDRYSVWPQTDDPEYLVYYQNAQQKIISNLKDSYPVVICYTADLFYGHCRIALSRSKITSENVDTLDNSYVFEPQTGMYAGKIGENYFICQPKDKNCKSLGEISIIITEDDILQFKDSKWASYDDYLSKTSIILSNFEKS